MLKLLFFFVFIHTISLYGQEEFYIQRSVKLAAETDNAQDQITLNWIADENVVKYTLHRKDHHSTDWGEQLSLMDSLQTSYVDTNVFSGEEYEYRVIKHLDTLVGYGYILSGYDIAPKHFRGKLLLVVESITSDSLMNELIDFQEAISNDGWLVDNIIVDKGESPIEVKSKILAGNTESNLRAVLLLGDVAVPHSGNINPDAHNDHKGGWSADLYYGDIDGEWSDSEVDNNTAVDPRVRNIPGDGNFDQSFIPSDIEIAVGRVDFSELPIFVENEFELLRNYLAKNIEYRSKEYIPRSRAILQERNLWKGGLGQNGIRAFSSTVSPDSISYLQSSQSVAYIDSYQWIFASGGGSQISLSFWGNSETFATNALQATFTMFFGSYFGNYDYENNFLRSALASGRTLTTVWAGAPHWQYHPMGLGYDMAHCTTLTQNNNDVYRAGFFPRSIHTNLLGDPTLKNYIVHPPNTLIANSDEGQISLSWNEPVAEVDGYYVYRRASENEAYELLNELPSTDNNYVDSCRIDAVNYDYLVRATQLQTSPSGSFHNLSIGAKTEVEVSNYKLNVGFDYDVSDQIITLTDTSSNATSIIWSLADGSFSSESELTFELIEGENIFTLYASNACQEDSISLTILATYIDDMLENALDILYPNPTSNILNISSEGNIEDVKIYNVIGDLVFSKRNKLPTKKQVLDLSSLSAGNYTVIINELSQYKILLVN